MRRTLILAAAAAITLAGCSLLISGKDTGRPCLNGKCPSGFVCENDACITTTTPVDAGTDGGTDGGGIQCTVATDCPACGTGAQVCSTAGQCGCAVMIGNFGSIGEAANPIGSFYMGGAALGSQTCGTNDTYMLCGGFSQ